MSTASSGRIYSVGATAKTQTRGNRAGQEEARGRQAREAQVASNASFQYRTLADLSGSESGTLVTPWIDFGHIQFTKEPIFLSGSKRCGQPGEPTLADDASNFDPAVHFTVPGGAMVLAWKQNKNGQYVGAKLLLFAFGGVPETYKVVIYGLFIGPALRGA